MSWKKRVLFAALLVGAAYFAVLGGRYSLLDMRRIRAEAEAESKRLDDLSRRIDSLKAWRDSLTADTTVLERLARERFGMIRDGEILYRFPEGSDSGAAREEGGEEEGDR